MVKRFEFWQPHLGAPFIFVSQSFSNFIFCFYLLTLKISSNKLIKKFEFWRPGLGIPLFWNPEIFKILCFVHIWLPWKFYQSILSGLSLNFSGLVWRRPPHFGSPKLFSSVSVATEMYRFKIAQFFRFLASKIAIAWLGTPILGTHKSFICTQVLFQFQLSMFSHFIVISELINFKDKNGRFLLILGLLNHDHVALDPLNCHTWRFWL